MNKAMAKVLRKLRKIDARWHPARHQRVTPEVDCKGQEACDHIRRLLSQDRPCLISRLGGTETPALVSHVDISDPASFWRKSLDFIQGRRDRFWWDETVKRHIFNFSGFFPTTDAMLTRYSIRTLEELKEIDLLGSWLSDERRLAAWFSPRLIRIPLGDLEPYLFANPWSEQLAGRKVLVIHPFEETIRSQYARRELLFADPRVLPAFELRTLKAVQSLVGNQVEFPDWFAALESMCRRIDGIDFDVALIGAGAYGLPLGVYIKRLGKQAVHLGGVTQVLFGIRGKRWDDDPEYKKFINEHWVRPQPHETPEQFRLLEKGAYW